MNNNSNSNSNEDELKYEIKILKNKILILQSDNSILLDENKLLQSVNSKEQNNITIDPQSKEACNVKSYGRESTVVPDTWTYKNELPMNGGQMNGIIGFDSLESQFAIFNPNKLNLQSANSPNLKNIAHDDLRKPIVYEN